MTELGQWLAEDDGQPLLAVISGAGGVGKTTLALRWLHDMRRNFPDGQLYIDLGAYSDKGPVEPEDAVEWFLLALGLPAERMPSGLSQREAMYRSLTADRSVAVLLDNALSAAQVRPLLPASSRSVVVVTSRSRLTGLSIGGARFVEIDPLTVADSVELLNKVIGDHRLAAERTEAEELARLCGGMPIALSVVAARLSAHPHRSLSREIVDLRGKDRLAALSLRDELSVESVFDMSYEELPTEEARLYRLCALHPGTTFGTDIAAAMVGRPVRDVEPALDALVERNLLTEIADRRFRYHDLLRVHARQQAGWEESVPAHEAAIRGMVEWYLDTTVAADLVLRPTRRRVGPRFRRPPDRSAVFRTHPDALRWLECERGNLVQAVRSAVEHGWDDLVWEFCEALWGFFLHSRHYGDWLELHRAGIPAAQRCGHRAAEARLRTQLGSALVNLRRYDDALRENLLALRLAEQEHDDFTKAAALSELAGAAQGKGDLPGALEYLQQAKQIRDVIGTARAVAVCQRRIGEVLAELGSYAEATTALHEAAEAMANLDTAQHARALTSLGSTYIRWGHLTAAATPLAAALRMTRELGSTHYQAAVLAALGDLAERTGDLGAARQHWSEAYEIYLQSEDPKAADLSERLARIATGWSTED